MATTRPSNGGAEAIEKKRKRKRGKESVEAQTFDETPATEIAAQLFELTDQCHHYTARKQIEYDIQKYWDQRYSIWSLYDEGIYMTDDAWFGVTPEPVANKVAHDFANLASASRTVLIDIFAGAGGNVIAFALSNRWSSIVAIEKDPAVIACAYRNAQIYGVADKITWVNDDSFAYLQANSSPSSSSSFIDASKTAIFASPPWGGPGYRDDEIFDLDKMQPYSVQRIHDAVRSMDSALYLPRQSDVRQLARLAPEGGKKIEIVQYCMMGASKAMVAYIPSSAPTTPAE
ncbi:uncharacterized protein L3040_009339 [Drepanopeziza brunnea f. sp. 'multigermtubi']|uniref:Trimethylguanosine synthase n=1 Tax=Marssonina brunnea f. sp. multigermtubi (strain MB_m1) TaxID=1072389 RepID=K1X1Z9_MARBU|nr:RNA cap guanine-N2 methyltransferase [Drepanopeziza brunnea f. sp. 'multigermtubi' MB_m1]EKD19221.1 RNA cap guanine-N2 methyltransferase [Drepanopeziza brunnea f. sp. 'multigermtubi' MB_m1]KAJ5032746.1 hypothetical protein L3040_009339 [Drepanopeziza brunnea f. sp. 'multigermtubi']